MAISSEQLSTWSNAGAQKTASDTYASVKTALEAKTSSLPQGAYDIYLQGSYRNSTNIYGDSDVDVVVEYTGAFQYDVARLAEGQQAEFHLRFPGTAPYTLTNFRADAEKSLIAYYGGALIEPGSKCIKVKAAPGRLNADVVPCIRYRRYDPTNPPTLPEPKQGITFARRDNGKWIVNYPKQHYDNGVTKNQNTSEWYKPTVRIFKNFRNRLVDDRLLDSADAPSYFVECLLYNVPNATYGGSYFKTVQQVLVWLGQACTAPIFDDLVTGSGLQWLFRSGETSWDKASAVRFILACLKAWNK
jgi:hypothetical protein